MTDSQFICYMAVNTLVALGTVSAAVVALFGDRLRAKWWPPKFEAEVRWPPDPMMPLTRPDNGERIDDAWFYHLTVKNTQKGPAAENVGLHLVSIEEAGPDGRPQTVWYGDVPVRCRNQESYPIERKMGSPIDYDLCMVRRSNLTLSLMPILSANNLPIIRTGRCDFTVGYMVQSAQGESGKIRVRIAWSGQWNNGQAEMANNLKPAIVI